VLFICVLGKDVLKKLNLVSTLKGLIFNLLSCFPNSVNLQSVFTLRGFTKCFCRTTIEKNFWKTKENILKYIFFEILKL